MTDADNADCPRMVLIVDDDRDVREALAEVVLDYDLEPHAASNGREALELLRSLPARPDLILLDIMMPVMDGHAFRAAQLANDDIKDIPVFVLTAHADAQKTAHELSADAWLKKPVPLRTLLDVIERFCPASCAEATG